jgi:hypothetical protein
LKKLFTTHIVIMRQTPENLLNARSKPIAGLAIIRRMGYAMPPILYLTNRRYGTIVVDFSI